MNDTTSLMARRIRRILLVCNNYDNFSLEEDGRLDMRISHEYAELNLSGPPVFERASSTREALERAQAGGRWDLVITLYNVGEVDVFDFAARMKAFDAVTPVVLLTSFSKEVYRQLERRDLSHIDHIFNWNGSTDLIIAIIKLLEDSMNAPQDILQGGVQCILLVEDSVRYYSTYLPLLYKLVLGEPPGRDFRYRLCAASARQTGAGKAGCGCGPLQDDPPGTPQDAHPHAKLAGEHALGGGRPPGRFPDETLQDAHP